VQLTSMTVSSTTDDRVLIEASIQVFKKP